MSCCVTKESKHVNPKKSISDLTLFSDIGRALVKSGRTEAYVVAGDTFADTGPIEVAKVLRDFEETMANSAFWHAHQEYQATQGGRSCQLEDGVTCYVLCDDVAIHISAALIGEGVMRLLFTKVDAIKLHADLAGRMECVERELASLRSAWNSLSVSHA